MALLDRPQPRSEPGGWKPPPDAPKAPATGAPDQSDHHDQLATDGTSGLSISRGPALLSRHNRMLCCLRSFQSFPCPRCCRCAGACDHPAFTDERQLGPIEDVPTRFSPRWQEVNG